MGGQRVPIVQTCEDRPHKRFQAWSVIVMRSPCCQIAYNVRGCLSGIPRVHERTFLRLHLIAPLLSPSLPGSPKAAAVLLN